MSTFNLYAVVCFFSLLIVCDALNCRSEGGPRLADLKNVMMGCVKKHSNLLNNTGSRDMPNERRYDGKVHASGTSGADRDRWMSGAEGDDAMAKISQYNSNRGSTTNRRYKRQLQREMFSSMPHSDQRNQYNSYRNTQDMSPQREDPYGSTFNQQTEFGDYMKQNERGNFGFGGSDDFRSKYELKNRDDSSPFSSDRSQGYDFGKYNNDFNQDNDFRMNMSFNLKDINNHECIIHCFLENLEMTGNNGMPDKYMVTQKLLKDVHGEDMKDFLHESVEECFQILYNDKVTDKCHFSKNLMTCLTEKGKANCDDWDPESFEV